VRAALACFLAGKPQQYDMFVLHQRFQTGSLAEADLLRLADAGRFGAIQLELPQRDAPLELAGRRRCPPAFLNRLWRDWDLAVRTPDDVVFTPRAAR
jgi:hypothetical protein